MTEPAPAASAFDPVALLSERFTAAIRAALSDLGIDPPGEIDPQIAPSRNPDFGDFQCNAAMGLAKRNTLKPRDVAQKIVEHADLSGLAHDLDAESIAGPGFINVRLKPETLGDLLSAIDGPHLGLPRPRDAETVVVDVCGVNLAKQMHVGHLRSSVIGDTIARVFERLGHPVVRQNHVGDWGLPIAMVTARLMRAEASGEADLGVLTLDDLNGLYRAAQRECAAERRALAFCEKWGMGPKVRAELEGQIASADEAMEHAKATLVRLQSGDPEVVRVWQRIEEITMAVCLETCRRLHTRIDATHSAGESSYREELAGVVEDLERRGIAEESDGALVVRVEGVKEPCLIRKRDGGFLYATTDLAAVRRRVQEIGADRVVYCVDARQGLHFRQVFGAAIEAGYATRGGSTATLEHAAFGTVLGEDNRPLKTRSGENIKLSALLDEAIERAESAVREANADKDETLSDPEIAEIAEGVGIAAVKYADLSNERSKDYVFSFDRMLAFKGDTGPYLLYALVRIRKILLEAGRAGIDTDSASANASFVIADEAEKALALAILPYPGVVRGVGLSLEPHRLCAFLYALATAFSSFYDKCPVVRAGDDATVQSRVRLCALVGKVLEDGLATLGIPTVERM
jgi:arginyl-tRNA synthetase